MSGIEFAGIAMAVISIAISVIQEYRTICESVLLLSQPRAKDAASVQLDPDIPYEVTRFQLIIRKLSQELFVPWITQMELQQAIRDENILKKREWRDAAMRHRLNIATNAFGETTNAVLEALDKLVKDLTVDLPSDQSVLDSHHPSCVNIDHDS